MGQRGCAVLYLTPNYCIETRKLYWSCIVRRPCIARPCIEYPLYCRGPCTSEPGRFHDSSQNSYAPCVTAVSCVIVAYYWYPHGGSAQCLPLAPTAVHIRTSEPPRQFEPFHRLVTGFQTGLGQTLFFASKSASAALFWVPPIPSLRQEGPGPAFQPGLPGALQVRCRFLL